MIVWDINVIAALVITLCLGVVIALWVLYTLKSVRAEIGEDRQYFRQCGFCAYVYFDYTKKIHGHCPRCGSYQ